MIEPTVGTVVHYMSYGTPNGEFKPQPRAAIITAIHNKVEVSLCIMNPTGLFFNTDVLFDSEGTGGTWNWTPEQYEQMLRGQTTQQLNRTGNNEPPAYREGDY